MFSDNKNIASVINNLQIKKLFVFHDYKTSKSINFE
jgi:hypothetical protein